MHSDKSNKPFEKRFDGRFSDGDSAGSKHVDVTVTLNGLVISDLSGGEPILWPYSSLVVAEPLRKNSIDVLLTCSEHKGATLFVPGSAFARELRGFAPHLTASQERWRDVRPWLLATLAFAGLVALVYYAEFSPARYVASFIPDKVRQTLGRQSINSMVGGRGVCVAPDGRAALDRLVTKLSKASGSDGAFDVTVADWGLVNAFATPGEQIVITRGLITNAKSADELAGVLAHEMGHGIGRHPETGLVRAIGLMATFELLSGGGTGVLANAGVLLAQLSYTRSAEREADERGLAILKAAEISPAGLTQFFERMSAGGSKFGKAKKKRKGTTTKDTNVGAGDKGKGWTPVGLDILRTHPATDERLARISRVPTYDATPALSNEDWSALRKVCSHTVGGADRTPETGNETDDAPVSEDDAKGGRP